MMSPIGILTATSGQDLGFTSQATEALKYNAWLGIMKELNGRVRYDSHVPATFRLFLRGFPSNYLSSRQSLLLLCYIT